MSGGGAVCCSIGASASSSAKSIVTVRWRGSGPEAGSAPAVRTAASIIARRRKRDARAATFVRMTRGEYDGCVTRAAEVERILERYLVEVVERHELCPWARTARERGELAIGVLWGGGTPQAWGGPGGRGPPQIGREHA